MAFKKRIRAEEIRKQAHDFLTAYKVLEKNYESATLAVMGPSVVCLALAMELYLKELSCELTGEVPRGHNIWQLFDELPLQIKQEIFSHESISHNPFMMRGNFFSPKYYSSSYSAYDRFIDQMKGISDGFIEWRYSYEESNLRYDSFFALALIEAIASTTNSIRLQQRKAQG